MTFNNVIPAIEEIKIDLLGLKAKNSLYKIRIKESWSHQAVLVRC